MRLRQWKELPEKMQTEEVRKYYDLLKKHPGTLAVKRVFDIGTSSVMLLALMPFMLGIGIAIKVDSPGPAIFKQERVTAYCKRFKIWKFRTMVNNADKLGSQLTTCNDNRVTELGTFLRKYRLDELPQLINILSGDMSFVGARPEVVKYVERYTPEMMATLLLPAGVTSEASIRFKDEYKLLEAADDVDDIYVNKILPIKMSWNLKSIEEFSAHRELLTLIRTVLAVLGREY